MDRVKEVIINSDGYYPQCPYCYAYLDDHINAEQCPECHNRLDWRRLNVLEDRTCKISTDIKALIHAIHTIQYTGKTHYKGIYKDKDFDAYIAHYKARRAKYDKQPSVQVGMQDGGQSD